MVMPAFNLNGSAIGVRPNTEKVAKSIKRMANKDFKQKMTQIINDPAIKETVQRLSKE